MIIENIEIQRLNFHELLKTNNVKSDNEIYKELKLKKPRRPYDPKFIQT